MEYSPKINLKPENLIDISNDQINDHWKLYEGYVAQVNKLNQELKNLRTQNNGDSLAYADRRRRLGFEYNGMVLHEYYFENLKANASDQKPGKNLLDAINKNFDSFDIWQKDFINTGKTRGIGWAILYLDKETGRLINAFTNEHQNGNIAGYTPIIVMDVWEHAYMVDHGATERGLYIDAIMKNINWDIAEKRYLNALNK